MKLTKRQEKLITNYLTMPATKYIWRYILNRKGTMSRLNSLVLEQYLRVNLYKAKPLAEGL